MTRPQWIIASVLIFTQVALYLAATVKVALIPLALGMTPLCLVPVGYIFGKPALDMIRGKTPDD